MTRMGVCCLNSQQSGVAARCRTAMRGQLCHLVGWVTSGLGFVFMRTVICQIMPLQAHQAARWGMQAAYLCPIQEARHLGVANQLKHLRR